MAAKASSFSKWGYLKTCGITEEQLLNVIVRGDKCSIPADPPTYGIVLELYYFANEIATNLQRRPNRILKCLMDTLFPHFSISRADRLERKMKALCTPLKCMAKEELAEYLQRKWIPQPTGKTQCDVTEEMKIHNLHNDDLKDILSNPQQNRWTLAMTPSDQFYVDLHGILKKTRIPVQEIGMIYRSIDPALRQTTISNKDAYAKVQLLVSKHDECSGSLLQSDHDSEERGSSDENQGHFAVCNVNRREKRAKAKIKELRNKVKYFKRVNKAEQEKIKNLSVALEESRRIIHERNVQIRKLKTHLQNHELTIDMLQDEQAQNVELADKECAKHNIEIEELAAQIKQLQEKDKSVTFHSGAYTSNVRELYYSLLSMRLPPAQIKTVVRNVIGHLVPYMKADELRLPGKSCAAYMRSQEMPTISRVQKASELMQAEEWHLASDGTTLQQHKKVAFLINGIVFGIHDVPSGSSQVALDALKTELAKTSQVAAEFLPHDVQEIKIDRIVSSTSDAAATQTKFTHLLERETGKKIIENKCSMHLGVNLRQAQVKAVAMVQDSSIGGNKIGATPSCSQNCDNLQTSYDESDPEEESDGDADAESAVQAINRDIDLFVHELAKLFGHLGTPEYCHGVSTFRIFLAQKAMECTGIEKEYYEFTQKIVLERQVGSRYFVTSCNAGRLYFLRKAMVVFLCEQKLVKPLNGLESCCLQKLQDPVLLANLQLEGLMFDMVYADLMTLVKSTALNKSALDMNTHYEELLEFFEILVTNPAAILDSKILVFKSEPLLYSQCTKLNHRLVKKYQPVHEELQKHKDSDESILFPMVTTASRAMHFKLQNYKRDHLPGGRYHDPDPQVSATLASLQPHNDRTEGVFGANDWLDKILPNMAQSTRSALVEFSYNKTMEWLKVQGEEQKQYLIALAQQRRKEVFKEGREQAKQLFEMKLQERKKGIEKGKEREKLRLMKLDEVKSEPLITSIDELNHRVTSITSLSIPKCLQDAEIKKMVQRQVQLRSIVHHQKGIKLNVTEKGKVRAVSELLRDLSNIITDRPIRVRRKEQVHQVHQQLYVVFEKPSLLRGVKVKHRFDVDGSLEWYEGTVLSVRCNRLTIYYQETDETCQFTIEEIKEDFLSGDFLIT